jgi:hypothetical protein
MPAAEMSDRCAEAVAEAQQCLKNGWQIDESVARELLRGLANAYSLPSMTASRQALPSPVVFDHDKYTHRT